MKTKFVLPKHTNLQMESCGNTVRIIWRNVGRRKVAKCAVCEKQLKPLTFEEVLLSKRYPISRAAAKKIEASLNGCGNGTICGSCWRCS